MGIEDCCMLGIDDGFAVGIAMCLSRTVLLHLHLCVATLAPVHYLTGPLFHRRGVGNQPQQVQQPQ